ncbi:hypothetical protein ACSNOI_03360 [Actinomadura kijaniata]|uniref:hypothetical protein n=1 Tax=Actinomadura kijaniata TaxID=46161 RepID=UPI003F1BBD6D
MALNSDDPAGQAARSPSGHAVCEFVDAGGLLCWLEVVLEDAAAFVGREVHQVGFGGAVLAGWTAEAPDLTLGSV